MDELIMKRASCVKFINGMECVDCKGVSNSSIDESDRSRWVNKARTCDRFISDVMSFVDCKTQDQINSRLFCACKKMGFDYFLYGGRFYNGSVNYSEKIISNYNSNWQEEYKNKNYFNIDPVVSHALDSLSPLIWTDGLYVNDIQQTFKEEAQKYGLIQGVTFPIQNRNGDVALLSMAISCTNTTANRHIKEMLALGQLLATLTHESMRQLVKEEDVQQTPQLSERELEILKWIARGKSTWEISKLISISEHGVTYHIRKIMFKFDVTSRHQAVTKSIALGLL